MQACLSHASNLVSAERCADAFLSIFAIESLLSGAGAIVGAVAVAAIFASLTFRKL